MSADLELVHRLATAEHGLAVVSVARADGSVHSSLVTAGILDGKVAFVARSDAAKMRLLQRSGRATVTFRAGWEWAAVDGGAEIAGGDPTLLRGVFTAAGGTHDDWDEFDRVMAAEGRVAVFVAPDRIVGTSAG